MNCPAGLFPDQGISVDGPCTPCIPTTMGTSSPERGRVSQGERRRVTPLYSSWRAFVASMFQATTACNETNTIRTRRALTPRTNDGHGDTEPRSVPTERRGPDPSLWPRADRDLQEGTSAGSRWYDSEPVVGVHRGGQPRRRCSRDAGAARSSASRRTGPLHLTAPEPLAPALAAGSLRRTAADSAVASAHARKHLVEVRRWSRRGTMHRCRRHRSPGMTLGLE